MRDKSLKIRELKEQLRGQTVVSIQPVVGSPLEKTEFIVAMALAAQQAGAKALRIEGVKNVAAVAANVTIPIIGIVKRDLIDSPVRITPYVEDVEALAAAGATIIAFDATSRVRPESRAVIVDAIQRTPCFGMADCSCFEDGTWAYEQGVEIIGSTLSGYVGGEEPTEPDLNLVRRFAAEGFFTMAEGRYNTPELAAKAIANGAIAVTVGSALTRLEVVTQWFNAATQAEVKQYEHVSY
ncbi:MULTISPECIES: putative N-acetylmannosamine-6-phosphate 2-epimerase [Vibrio]|uniref:Putative N-acetylmannosamine-6-phosphate 2-epimerase n=1 Tax=Vibrio mediterranei TaxID=689 RepID=A0ABX5DEK8_9VIBR|nr:MULTISPECIES: N-acetylmannosamine-6-phosphate 2-epimerase [Vibrio]MCF4173586.1 N-acetylmannosamine-6-phosphate 2-epimerase [Vibrio sp. McD22-P3]MCG9663252.1 N-acetylmannosamine-6-phosphate 2-epimerase [Vibrio mediterranei]NOI23903.1 N-acetylmannosamine-6-phosphate 2-epimerase [Vibrio mediterranei]PCD89566.1 N-acetylmannosamine-6-phosphate 2-epimerase [Vibrio mediterranei]PRQ68074.1 N-acetylmannosamine-6-phosphate 2-epimerase [Vibrio mediterranei]